MSFWRINLKGRTRLYSLLGIKSKRKTKAIDPTAERDDSIILVNTDDEIASAQGIDLLLACIFREKDIRQRVAQDSGPAIAGYKTYEQVRRHLFDHFQQRAAAGNLEPWEKQAHRALTEHAESLRLNLKAYIAAQRHTRESGFWPNPTDPRNGRDLFTEFPFRNAHKFITPKTRLVSAGSCFAVEIAHELQRKGYNYLVTEPNSNGFLLTEPKAKQISDASAAWGTIFNNSSFRQLVERAFGVRELPRILWNDRDHYRDPFRDEVKFATMAEYVAGHDKHVAAARDALSRAEVFIITLGLNEVWSFKADESVFSRSPWRIAPSFVEHRTLTVEENAAELQRMLDVLRRFNPSVRVIVSLSPVPLHATFLHEDYHVVESNTHSKAVLRVAAQEFIANNEGVYYFPSFELITYGTKNAWKEDQRHVNRAAVERVMGMFREMFVAS